MSNNLDLADDVDYKDDRDDADHLDDVDDTDDVDDFGACHFTADQFEDFISTIILVMICFAMSALISWLTLMPTGN